MALRERVPATQRPDCVAGHIGFEPANPSAHQRNHVGAGPAACAILQALLDELVSSGSEHAAVGE